MSDSPRGGPDVPSADRRELDGQTIASISTDYKVLGEKDAPDGTGVLGHNTATSGPAHGVEGITESGDATAEQAGVYGEATRASGWSYGVHGVTNSENINAAGVRAEATGAAQGLFAESSGNTGAAGVTKDGAESGVFGINNADTNTGSTGHGVRGQTDSTGAASAGVYGKATGSSGQTYGVRGETPSNDAGAAGVYGESSAGSGDAAAIHAEGHVDVTSVGLSAYRSASAGPQTISSGGDLKTVIFDSVWSNRDDFGGLNASTGEYTVGAAGDYHVSSSVEWVARFSGGVIHKIFISVDGIPVASRYHEVPGASSESSYVHSHLCKTLYGLGKGDTITIDVYHEAGVDKDLSYDSESTYVTIDKVG